jgi:hypothetical protein
MYRIRTARALSSFRTTKTEILRLSSNTDSNEVQIAEIVWGGIGRHARIRSSLFCNGEDGYGSGESASNRESSGCDAQKLGTKIKVKELLFSDDGLARYVRHKWARKVLLLL